MLATLDMPPCDTSYATTLTDLHTEFNHGFSDFAKTEGELMLVPSPHVIRPWMYN